MQWHKASNSVSQQEASSEQVTKAVCQMHTLYFLFHHNDDYNFTALGVPQEILAYTLGSLNRGDSMSETVRSDKDRRERLDKELNDILRHNHTSIPHLLAAASLRYIYMVHLAALGGSLVAYSLVA